MIEAVAIQEILRKLAPIDEDVRADLKPDGDIPALLVELKNDPARWFVVASAVNRWQSLETDGAYTTDHFEEDISEEDLELFLRHFTELGLIYLREGGVIKREGFLKLPVLLLELRGESFELRQPLLTSIRSVIRGKQNPA